MRGRAFRRYQVRLAAARARRFLALVEVPCTPCLVGKYRDTRVPCSCWMCGNPRRYEGERTRQELLHELPADWNDS